MRALTVRQPWAWAIVHGGKDVENRTRNVAGAYRGPVAIHAALAHDNEARPSSPEVRAAMDDWWSRQTAASLPEVAPWWTLGAILAVVDVVDAHHADDCYERDLARLAKLYREDPAAVSALPDTGAGGIVGRARLCSPWAQPDVWHLALANPRPLPEPVPWRGRLGLWRLDDEALGVLL